MLTEVQLMELSCFEPLKIFFKVESDLNALDKVLSHFEQINQGWISRKDWLQCQLALAEGFTNAVRHAHKGLSPTIPIEIEITLTNEQIKIMIWDYGNPFNLPQFLKENVTSDNYWSSHGRGLSILQQIADHLDYIRTEQNRNCLIIIKQFPNQQENQ
ncbi:putative anti-sigma regulatory factor, serine/threonine protein kinase [Gloeothece citriformis PCC 7424]|uniref:Putative anti-sigma regulatory factor, serine/threonine protein kinase n=1 Tax=Gloeothece citriformis (strain PCC 7424) TaxID=65393 RepID=B7KHT4_GLOC7|nr:putative anti-sigma regulatory factor, serine/threonine protein kinase [Gloeothece citriformis PCC 7424]